MTFFRIKKIKDKEYAYIVENKWKNGSSRQKVREYIGRAYRFHLVNEVSFMKFVKIDGLKNYLDRSQKNIIIKDLIEWELFKFGINREEFSIDLDNSKIQKNNKNVVLLINDGFMCNATLRGVLNFRPKEGYEFNGFKFAKAFVEAGIKIPEDVFVDLFEKMNLK